MLNRFTIEGTIFIIKEFGLYWFFKYGIINIMRIFLFHRVSEIKDEFWPPMRPKTFQYLIKKFTKKYHVVNLEDYLRGKFDKQINHEKIASIVFDDGYKDFINYAFPILKKFQIKPSMYVVTNAVENNEPIWTYKVDKIIANTSKSLDFSKYNSFR